MALLVAACGAEDPRGTPTGSIPSPSGDLQSDRPATSSQPSLPQHVDAASLSWRRIGSIGNFRMDGLVGFDGGYVAYGTTYLQGLAAAWFSPDGVHWSMTELVRPDTCTSTPHEALDNTAGAGNGHEVALLALGCDGEWFTWTSPDGRTWTEAPVAAQSEDYPFAGPVLATGEGWELIMERAGALSVHRSVDGRRWEMPAGIGLSSVACCLEAGVDPSGTRLIGDHLGLLATSHDGVSWREIEIPYTPATPGGNSLGRDWLQAIVAPIASAPAWVLVTSRMDGTPATTWISQDLVTWATGKFPMAEVQHMARTRFGIVATGRDACGDGRCARSERAQFLSQDGVTWAPTGSSVNALQIADGPAGVIAIGLSAADTPDLTVWLLGEHSGKPADPPSGFTPDEEALLIGLRPDAQVGCAPKGDELPAGALAAVECVLDADLISRIGVYLFPTDRDAARAYLERLSSYGVKPNSGSCLNGEPGDGAWTPGDGEVDPHGPGGIEFDGQSLVTVRSGCFHNEQGFANVRVTCGGGVYIGVLGSGRDIGALARWVDEQLFQRSSPSPPGICSR